MNVCREILTAKCAEDANSSVIELAKHLPDGERYRQKDKSARQVAE
jgi:hypothetical protein